MAKVYYYPFVYIVFFFCSVLFSVLTNGLFLKFATTLGIRGQDKETVIRWGPQSKPAIGGLSFYIIFLLSITCYSIFFDINQVFLNKQFVGLLLSSTVGFLIGLADDAYNTKPFLKFAAQITCGLILIASGVYIDISGSMLLNYFITLFWVVGIMNSINMLDNMDAIASLVSASIILAAMAVIFFLYDYTRNIHSFILTGVLASLLGFLYFNWHPAKIYMGDTGSQFLGAFLSAVGIIYFWNSEYSIFHDGTPKIEHLSYLTVRNLVLPLLVFIIPIIDTSVVVINRISKGKSPFIGGKDHTSHTLAKMGLSDRQVALAFSLISGISLVLVIIIVHYILTWNPYYSAALIAYFLLLFSCFIFLARKFKHSEAEK